MSEPSPVASLLRELVRIPSPSGDEAAAAEFCIARLAERGIDAERVGDSVLARLDRGAGPTLFLNSHLDTVPVGQGWTREPLAAEWEGERLYGRGANDAKASVAAMLHALFDLTGDASWRGTVLLGLSACEETTNAGMGALLGALGAPGTGGLPDAAVTGEPTGLRVCRAQSGLAVLRAVWSGRSCHAAHVARAEHVNALLVAASQVVATGPCVELEGRHPLLGASTVAPTVMRAGERHNVVPDRAEVLFDARLAPPHDAAEAVRALERLLPDARVLVQSERLRPVETSADHALVRTALRCAGAEEALGSATLSDMALLIGVPAVKCGPGETRRSHTPDEFVTRSELEAGRSFYAALVPAALEALRSPEPSAVPR